MTAVVETLATVSIFAVVIFCAIMIFQRLAKNRVSPVLQCALWLILIARLAFPFTVESGFHFYTAPAPQNVAADTAPIEPEETVATVIPDPSRIVPQPEAKTATTNSMGNAAFAQGHEEDSSWMALPSAEEMIILVWLAGVLCVAAVLIGCRIAMARRVKKGAVLPDERIGAIFQQCREALGVRGKISIRLCATLSTPALTVSLRPTLLLPLDLYSAEDEVLRYALLHELTHYQRKDHLLRIAMNILKAVWWFNPVVWLADRRIVMDMETACDSMVVRRMEKEEKRRYASTVLEMFSAEKAGRYVLGMALGSSKTVAEKRIRGMYMNGKTKRGAKLAALILTGVMGVACFTTACAPAQAVNTEPVNKASFVPVEGASSTAQPQAEIPRVSGYELTDTWQESFDTSNITVKADAPVLTFTANEIPYYESKPALFTQAQVDGFAKQFLGDGPVYDNENYISERGYQDMKKELEEALKTLKSGSHTSEDGTRSYDINTTPENIEQALADLEKNYAARLEQVPATTALKDAGVEQLNEDGEIEMGVCQMVNVKTNMPDGSIGTMIVYLDAGNHRSEMRFNRETTPGSTLSISAEEAERQAIEAAKALGIDQAFVFGTRRLEANGGEEYVGDERVDSPFYRVVLTRNRQPELWFMHTFGSDTARQEANGRETMYDHDFMHLNERIVADVDDKGIVSFAWSDAESEPIVQGTTELAPFSQVLDTFRQEIGKKHWIEKDDHAVVYVQKVMLVMQRVLGDDGVYRVQPVWEFLGHDGMEMDEETMQQEAWYNDPLNLQSLLTVSAVDAQLVDTLTYSVSPGAEPEYYDGWAAVVGIQKEESETTMMEIKDDGAKGTASASPEGLVVPTRQP